MIPPLHHVLPAHVGPGKAPAVDVVCGSVAVGLFLRSIISPHAAPPEALAKVGSADSLRACNIANHGVRARAMHLGIRVGPLVLAVLGLYMKGWPSDRVRQRQRVLFVLANSMTILGSIIRLYCFRTLGKYFTFDLAVQDGQKVIRKGLYGYIRHPSYTGAGLTFIGTVAAGYIGNPLIPRRLIPVSAAIGAAQLFWMLRLVAIRVQDEEALMRRELGQEYEEYVRDVPRRFLPFVW